jgi:hypothetical protein
LGERPPPALDAGERMLLAERYADASGAASEAGDGAAAQAWLANAVDAVDAVLGSMPAESDAVPESAFISAAGRELRDAEPGRFTRARLSAYRDGLARAGGGEARDSALAAAALIGEAVKPMLQALAKDREGALLRSLRPQAGDYDRVFTPEAAPVARAGLEALWSGGLELDPPPGREVIVHAAPAGLLASDNALSRHFPPAYRAIASWLDPHRVWVTWKYVRPGETSGLAYDGLVWVDDHWAWFPKPWRVLTQIPSARSRSS